MPPIEVADRERDAEREDDPDEVQAVDPADEPVLVEILAVRPPLLHAEVREQPTHVRVHEAAQRAAESLAVPTAASAGRRAGRRAHGACGDL